VAVTVCTKPEISINADVRFHAKACPEPDEGGATDCLSCLNASQGQRFVFVLGRYRCWNERCIDGGALFEKQALHG
jgi:hypothetical protein